MKGCCWGRILSIDRLPKKKNILLVVGMYLYPATLKNKY